MDVEKIRERINAFWKGPMLQYMTEFGKIPNLSPNFDPEIHTNGKQEAAMDFCVKMTKELLPKGAKLHTYTCNVKNGTSPDGKDRTPLILVDVPASNPACKGTILAYNHYDKQPWMLPWSIGGPIDPVLVGDKLYCRGAADDGYGGPAALEAIRAIQDQSVDHCRIVCISEFSEESGSCDLPFWIEHTKDLIGTPDVCICLDAGCLSWDTMYTTCSLRGVAIVDITIDTMALSSIHSGIGGGVVPDCNRIWRQLMNRIEDVDTGAVKLKSMNVPLNQDIVKLLAPINDMSEKDFMKQFPLLEGVMVQGDNVNHKLTNIEKLLKTTWEPTITVVGYGSADDAPDRLPACPSAGNVIRGSAHVRLSCRLPPGADQDEVAKEFVEVIEANPPLGAKVTCKVVASMAGWVAPKIAPWLDEAMNRASHDAFGKPYAATVVGGGIPLMNMLVELFPQSQFCITGVLGPGSNAHAPDEFLCMDYGSRINLAVARIIVDTSVALNK